MVGIADAPPRSKDAPMMKTMTKPGQQPAHAWTIVAHDDNEKYDKNSDYFNDYMNDGSKGSNLAKAEDKKGGAMAKHTGSLKLFICFLKCYGVDFTAASGSKLNVGYVFLRCFIMAVTLFFLVVHWVEIVCTLKEDFLQYGSCLVNLVFTARITSGVVSHIIFCSRRKIIIKLLEKLDDIGEAVRFTVQDKRKIAVLLVGALSSIFLYCALPVKYFRNPTNDDRLLNSTDTLRTYFNVHSKTMLILENIPVNFLTFFVLLYDVLALSFFVSFSFRFYSVFHAAPFCKWLNNGSKHEIGDVMKRFRQHHNVICDVVEQVDAAFAPTVLIWYVYLTLALCCWIRAFSTSAFESIGGAVIVSVAILTTLIEFYILSVGTSLINDEVTAHLDSIRMMCINEDLEFTSSMTALQDRISHLSYVTCVLASPVALTGWGFFSVSKGFVLTVSSTVLTFTLVLYGV